MTKKEKLLEGIKKMSDKDFWYWMDDILGRDLVTDIATDFIKDDKTNWPEEEYDFLIDIGVLKDGDNKS